MQLLNTTVSVSPMCLLCLGDPSRALSEDKVNKIQNYCRPRVKSRPGRQLPVAPGLGLGEPKNKFSLTLFKTDTNGIFGPCKIKMASMSYLMSRCDPIDSAPL